MEKGKLNPLLLLLTLIATILACNAPTPVTPTESSPTLTTNDRVERRARRRMSIALYPSATARTRG